MSPYHPQHTDTHTETFFSRRKTQFEGNRPKHIKPKKNNKPKKNLTLKTGTFSPHLISFLSFNHRENLSTPAPTHYHLNR